MLGAVPYSRTIIGGLPWYSALMVLGIFIAYLLGAREEKRLKLPKDTMIDVTLVAVPFGIIGARLYYVLFSLDQFRDNPISILYIWEGGIAIYGAVIGGTIAVWVYARRKKISLASILDMLAPGLILAQAIGRWGNYFNQEAFGPLVTNPKLQFYPFAVLITQGEAASWHMATFFYESMWNVGVFLLLWLILRKKRRREGDTFLWYMVLYSGGRFWIEGLRTDSLMLGGLRFSQALSLIMLLGVGVVFLMRSKEYRRSALVLALAAARFTLNDCFPYSLIAIIGLYAAFAIVTRENRLRCIIIGIIDILALTALHLWGARSIIDLMLPYLGLTTPALIAIEYRLTPNKEAALCP